MEDLLSKKSPEVVEYINQIEQVRKIHNLEHYDLACDLFDMAQERGNDDLKDYASCALGDACCQNDDFPQALYYITAGISGLEKTDEYLLISRSYNELGIIYSSQGHVIKSLENFIASIDVAREHRLYLQEAIGCSNFAALCEEMGATTQSIEYHYRSVECCGFIEDEKVKNDFLVCEFSLMAKLYVMLGDNSQAKIFIDEMDKLIQDNPEYDDYFDIQVCRWFYYRETGNKEKAAECKSRCLKIYYDCTDFFTFHYEAITFVDLMVRDKEYDELEKVFKHIDEIELDEELINLHMHMERFKIAIYKELDDREKMMEAGFRYFEYDSMKNEDNKRSFITTLQLKSELTQQKTTNLFLSAAAETDTLTGLANRTKLNTVIDELFIMASKNRKSLGVEMMDVDFFKQVNDTYGHAKGDELLKSMGKAFRDIINDKIFIARYGGDEFVLYYYDMTDDEITEIVKRIQDEVRVIGHELELGEVTVSQGIVNRVPNPVNRAWDYLNSADYALYYVKEHGKANARIIHGRKDLETTEWIKVF